MCLYIYIFASFMCIVEKKCLRKQMPASASSLLWSFPKRSAPSGIASNQRQQTANACVKGPCCFASTYLEKSSSLAGSILSARFSQSNGNRGGHNSVHPVKALYPKPLPGCVSRMRQLHPWLKMLAPVMGNRSAPSFNMLRKDAKISTYLEKSQLPIGGSILSVFSAKKRNMGRRPAHPQ